jgi:hypothetical protein
VSLILQLIAFIIYDNIGGSPCLIEVKLSMARSSMVQTHKPSSKYAAVFMEGVGQHGKLV